jgi:RecG-like helicase
MKTIKVTKREEIPGGFTGIVEYPDGDKYWHKEGFRQRKNELYINNPKIEMVGNIPDAVGNSLFGQDAKDEHTMYPVYPESKGISSLWFYHAIQKIFNSKLLDTIKDPIPEDILKKYNLPNIRTAFIWIHTPRKTDDSLSAKKRLDK